MLTRIFICILGLLLKFPVYDFRVVPPGTASQCGYQSCHPVKENLINVHLVAHTHDDVGWLKTVDQYYYGSNNTIQNAGVQYILDSVIDELKKDPNRRFIYVETAFFWKWWKQQDDVTRHQVQALVYNGQLEFIGGAWSMNDEATTHYQSIIDQFAWGLRKLNDTFGECGRPKIGWQVDPFGHSREMASIFTQMGFDALLLGRIDFEDKENRFASKSPEMIWQGSSNLGESSNIFTSVMYNRYSPPPGFCFDILCEDEPLVDDKKSPLYNIDRRLDEFFKYVDDVAKVYTTNNIILTMGNDFNYQDAHTWFVNLDKLIHYGNLRQNVGSKYNLIYSTPSCYIKSVYDAKKQFPSKTDDFFPYGSDNFTYWTGYFTSRPTLKRFERQSNNFLQVCKQLYVLADLGPEDRVDLNPLREALGVVQHHDAIAGTEKQHVAEDYARILQNGIDECQFLVNTALSQIITGQNTSGEEQTLKIDSCWLTNVSSCPLTESEKNFTVTVYNPLSRPANKYIRLPVLGKAYQVKDPEGNSLEVQMLPIPKPILQIPGRESKANVELIFLAENIPPLGFNTYFVTNGDGNLVSKPEKLHELTTGEVQVAIDPTTGLLTQITMNGKTIEVNQEFLYYEGFVGNNLAPENRSSGAYIFRPVPNRNPVVIANKAKFEVIRGNLVSEVRQIYNDWVSQTIRLYNKENFVEFDWVVGPIPQDDANGREVITRIKADLQTKSVFYTDSNGREMIKRTRNHRPTWNVSLPEPVSGNYYPVTSKIILIDEEENIELAVLTDRAHGGSSLEDGQVELMLHRTCKSDDAFGVGESLIEVAYGKGLVARGSYFLILGSQNNPNDSPSTAAQERDLAQKQILAPWTLISPYYKNSNYLNQFSGLKRALPQNVQILTLEPWKGSSFLLRLEHVLEKDEDAKLSKTAVISLTDLFTTFDIVSIQETTLGANQWLKDNDRLNFDVTVESSRQKRSMMVEAGDDLEITLNPMQIRTFIIEVKIKFSPN